MYVYLRICGGVALVYDSCLCIYVMCVGVTRVSLFAYGLYILVIRTCSLDTYFVRVYIRIYAFEKLDLPTPQYIAHSRPQ